MAQVTIVLELIDLDSEIVDLLLQNCYLLLIRSNFCLINIDLLLILGDFSLNCHLVLILQLLDLCPQVSDQCFHTMELSLEPNKLLSENSDLFVGLLQFVNIFFNDGLVLDVDSFSSS